ncbi:MAG: hypothetical protein RIB61_15780 [Roseicyclus sp.]
MADHWVASVAIAGMKGIPGGAAHPSGEPGLEGIRPSLRRSSHSMEIAIPTKASDQPMQ